MQYELVIPLPLLIGQQAVYSIASAAIRAEDVMQFVGWVGSINPTLLPRVLCRADETYPAYGDFPSCMWRCLQPAHERHRRPSA
jgi:hypothetical protein